MASYARPNPTQIMDWTGVNTDIRDDTASELATTIATISVMAEAETQAQVGATNFARSDLESYQVTLLQEAVARRTAARFIENPRLRQLTGTAEPLLFEDPEELRKWLAEMNERAVFLTDLCRSSLDAGSAPVSEADAVQTGFASDDDRTFTRAMEW